MLIESETSRLRSLLVNSGRWSFPEADQRLLETSLALVVNRDELAAPAAQAAFLTAVAVGVRCFGEVAVPPALDIPATTPLPVSGETLADQARVLGARERGPEARDRQLVIGGSEWDVRHPAVRSVWSGWSAAVQPAAHSFDAINPYCALAAAASGALGVAEAFFMEYGNARAGRRLQGLSLWSPGSNDMDALMDGFSLPLSEWVVGLGNLGQAHLWCLALMPYPNPADVELVLQDFDRVRAENWATSLLVQKGRYGMLKTRLAEDWCLARGFAVRRIDRRVDEQLRRQEEEPAIALAGLDKIPPRRLLGHVGFDHIVDVGLGANAESYHQMRVTSFDRSYSPLTHFEDVDERHDAQRTQQLPAYQALLSSGAVDPCGLATLAGVPVAVPFVSLLASAVAVAQLVRLASGVAPLRSLTGSVDALGSMRQTRATTAGRPTFPIIHDVGWA